MIKFKPIEITDKRLFDNYFNLTDFRNSEKNFSNLYIWRNEYDYKYAIVEGFLSIIGKSRTKGKTFAHFPYGDGNICDVLSIIKQYFKDNNYELIFFPVLNEMKDQLNQYDFNFIKDRNSFDYIYSSDKLINLKGSKLRNKRRWIKKFTNKYDYTYEPIDKLNLEEAREFTINEIKNTNNDLAEILAMEEMFDNFYTLGIKGCIIKVNGKIVGVSTGEQLTKDTIIIHCERANRDYEGIYNVLNQDFVKNQWAEYKYINREQDLGMKGLRQAKLTYRPDILLEKYVAKGV